MHTTLPSCMCLTNRWQAISSMLLLLILAVALPEQAHAWYPQPDDLPAVPSDENRFAFVAVDDTGTVHTTWVHGTDDLTLYYMRGILNSEGTAVTWEPNQPLIDDVDANSNPRLAVDASGTVHLVYGASKNVFSIENSARGAPGSWSTPELVATTTLGFHSLVLALAEDGTPYIAWCEGVGQENPSVVTYSYKNAAGLWEAPVIASEPVYLADKLSMVVRDAGERRTLHMVYVQRDWEFGDPYIGYSRGAPDDEFTYIRLSRRFDQEYGDDPSIALDATTGTLFVAFTRSHGEQDRGVYESYSMVFSSSIDDGRTWDADYTTIRSDKNTWPGQSWMIANNNTIHMVRVQKVLHGTSILDNGIYYQRINAATDPIDPPTPQHIGDDTAGAYPYLAAGSNALVAVWIDSNVIKYNVHPIASDIGPGDDPTEEPTTQPDPVPPLPGPVVGTVYLPVVMQ